MRIAALYDVHGNLPALEAVLADPRCAAADLIVVGGDLVAGPMPGECVDAACRGGRASPLSDGQLRSRDGLDDDRRPRVRGEHALERRPARCRPRSDGSRSGRRRSSSRSTGSAPSSSATRRRRPTRRSSRPPRPTRTSRPSSPASRATSSCVATRTSSTTAASRTCRVVNAGSVGMPYEGSPDARWALLDGDGVELRLDATTTSRPALELLAATGFPALDDGSREALRGRGRRAEEATARLREPSAWRVATSARRGAAGSVVGATGSGRSSSASRGARRRDDRASLPERRRAAHLRDALGADDRREREPRHRAALREVPATRGLPGRARRRSWSRTSSRPASIARRRSRSAARCASCSRSSTARCPRRLDDLLRLPGVARKTANVVAAELGHAQGIVVDTHVRRLSQRLGLTRNDDPVKIERDLQRVVPRADWARLPAPPDLARATDLRRTAAAVRGVRARSTSARRRAS